MALYTAVTQWHFEAGGKSGKTDIKKIKTD